jgi:hypothetical protein
VDEEGSSKPNAQRVDRKGKALKIGDKIRFTGIPPDVLADRYDEEELKTRTVFERSLGRVFPVASLDDNRVELLVGKVMGRPAYEHNIYLDPDFVEFAAKPGKPAAKSAKSVRRSPKRGRVLK